MIAEGLDAVVTQLLEIARAGSDTPRSGGGRRSKSHDTTVDATAQSAPASTEQPARILPSGNGRPQRGPAADMRAKRQRGARSAPRRRGAN